MKNLKFLFGLLVVIMATFFIYSCSKDADKSSNTVLSSTQTLENRTSTSACSPRSLFTEYVNCDSTPVLRTINFASGLGIYSTGSKIYQLCQGLVVNVSFMLTTCYDNQGDPIHFVHNLNYNLAQMTAACPALQTYINNQAAQGNLIGVLDLIDHEISMQTEYTLAFEAATQDQLKYLCSNGKRYSVKYIKNTCYRWVPYLDGPKDRPIPSYKKENCNGSVCCARTNSYCVAGYINGLPNIVTGTSTTYQKFEGSCPIDCTHDCGGPRFGDF